MHGPGQRARRGADRRPVAGHRRTGRRGRRRHPAAHHPPGLQFHFVHKGDLRPLIRTLERAPGHHAGRLRRRRAQRRRLPGARGRQPASRCSCDRRPAPRRSASGPGPAPTTSSGSTARRPSTAEGPRPPASRASRSTATPTCPASSRSASPCPATTASTSTAKTSASCPCRARTARRASPCWSAAAWARATPARTTPTPAWPTPLVWVPGRRRSRPLVEAIITAHRDFGNREDRHRARLKYVLDERGLDAFRAEVEARVGHALADPRRSCPSGTTATTTSAGTARTTVAGSSACPCRVGPRRTGRPAAPRSREVVERYGPSVRLTPRQDVLLTGIDAADRADVVARLRGHGVAAGRRAAPPSRRLRHGLPGPADLRPGPGRGRAGRCPTSSTRSRRSLDAARPGRPRPCAST